MPEMPTRKVNVGALAGALSLIVVWLIGDVPGEVAVAFSTVASFALSYVVPNAE